MRYLLFCFIQPYGFSYNRTFDLLQSSFIFYYQAYNKHFDSLQAAVPVETGL